MMVQASTSRSIGGSFKLGMVVLCWVQSSFGLLCAPGTDPRQSLDPHIGKWWSRQVHQGVVVVLSSWGLAFLVGWSDQGVVDWSRIGTCSNSLSILLLVWGLPFEQYPLVANCGRPPLTLLLCLPAHLSYPFWRRPVVVRYCPRWIFPALCLVSSPFSVVGTSQYLLALAQLSWTGPANTQHPYAISKSQAKKKIISQS